MTSLVTVKKLKHRGRPTGITRVAFSRMVENEIEGLTALGTIKSFMGTDDYKCVSLDLQSSHMTNTMFQQLNNLIVAEKITHLYIRGNHRLTDESAPLIADIIIRSTRKQGRTPYIDILDPKYQGDNLQFSEEALRKLKSVQTRMGNYVKHHRGSHGLTIASATLTVLLGLIIAVFTAASIAAAIHLHVPLLILLAALSTFVGGPNGVTIICLAAVAAVNIISVNIRSLIEKHKDSAKESATVAREELRDRLESESPTLLRRVDTKSELQAPTPRRSSPRLASPEQQESRRDVARDADATATP